jgi:hypothetical protein
VSGPSPVGVAVPDGGLLEEPVEDQQVLVRGVGGELLRLDVGGLLEILQRVGKKEERKRKRER